MKNTSLGKLLTATAIACTLTLTARAADSKVSSMDKSFAMKAAMGGMFEVDAGKVAADKAMSQDVKDFGSKMVEDHGKANDELKSISGSKSIDLPMALDSKHQKMLDALNGKSGEAFDKAYLSDMNKAHKMDDALFMKEADKGSDTDLKAFADKTDKTVKMHISMLKDIDDKMMKK